MLNVEHVLLGQSLTAFQNQGYDLTKWELVTAQARRRRSFFDGKLTLACYISSRTDIDDMVPHRRRLGNDTRCDVGHHAAWNTDLVGRVS